MPRHWFNQATKVKFSELEMRMIIDETVNAIDSVFFNVSKRLPHNFPDDIASAIVDGVRKTSSNFKDI